jgi:hypothetical protein
MLVTKKIYHHLASVILFVSIVSVHYPAQSLNNNIFSIANITTKRLVVGSRDLTDVSIGDIKIGMTLQQVTSKLGKPAKLRKVPNQCGGGEIITLKYDRLVINVTEGRVLKIDSSNPIYQTGERIKIGDPIDKAKQIYDKILATSSTYDRADRELLYNRSADGVLRFKSRNGKITSMSMMVDDC